LRDGGDIEILFSLMKLDPRKKEFLTPQMEEFFRKIHTMGTITELLVGNVPAAAILAFASAICSWDTIPDSMRAIIPVQDFTLRHAHQRAIEAGVKTYNFLQGGERTNMNSVEKTFSYINRRYVIAYRRYF